MKVVRKSLIPPTVEAVKLAIPIGDVQQWLQCQFEAYLKAYSEMFINYTPLKTFLFYLFGLVDPGAEGCSLNQFSTPGTYCCLFHDVLLSSSVIGQLAPDPIVELQASAAAK